MKRATIIYLMLCVLLQSASSCGAWGSKSSKRSLQMEQSTPRRAASSYTYRVVESYPHSTTSYTQGLQFIDGQMWESTGLNGASRLMKIDLKSGKTEIVARLAGQYFGEGLTVLGDSIFYLTWQSEVAMVYDRTSGAKVGEFDYLGEGWGLTSDGKSLYMSNGTAEITVRDPRDFSIKRCFEVLYNGMPLGLINEMEWIEGKIWANVYTTNSVVIFDPSTGVVEGVVDLSGLLPREEITPETDYLNGIAYDQSTGRIFVTGKNWSKLFEIEITKL